MSLVRRKVLLLSYSAMKQDIGDAVKKIVAHCGFSLTPAQVTELLPLFSFENMKANLSKFDPTSVRWRNKGDGFQFIRKGTVGMVPCQSLQRRWWCIDLLSDQQQNCFAATAVLLACMPGTQLPGCTSPRLRFPSLPNHVCFTIDSVCWFHSSRPLDSTSENKVECRRTCNYTLLTFC